MVWRPAVIFFQQNLSMQIKIRTHRVIHNHAVVLCALLREMGHEVSIVDEVDPDDDTLYIIYVAFSTIDTSCPISRSSADSTTA